MPSLHMALGISAAGDLLDPIIGAGPLAIAGAMEAYFGFGAEHAGVDVHVAPLSIELPNCRTTTTRRSDRQPSFLGHIAAFFHFASRCIGAAEAALYGDRP